ncbi:MAG: recombinase, partial [archaeon]|nr:recombinase [archaeon]
MVSVKITLRKKKNNQEKYPLAIRITKDRKSSFLYTGQCISLNQWDEKFQRVKKNHPNSAYLNSFT